MGFDFGQHIYIHMSNYKNYLLRQMGIKESQIKPSIVERNAYPGIDPDELETGIEDEKDDHDMSSAEANLTARQHLEQPDQGHYYTGTEKAKKAGMLKDALGGGMLSPTAIPTPVIAIGIRGSSTGGLPSGMDQSGIPSNTPTGRLGGYEPIPTAKDNNISFNKTPINPTMVSPNTKTENPSTTIDPHPHQTQRSQGEPPQSVTGASTDGGDSPLTLKSAAPKDGIDIDVPEEGKEKEEGESNDMDGEESMEDEDRSKQDLNEGKHKAGCQCGFCTNKKRFGKKDKDEDDGDDQTEKDDKGGDKKKKFGGLDETFAKHKSYAFESMKTLGSFIKEESQPEPYDAKTDQFAPGPRDRTNEPSVKDAPLELIRQSTIRDIRMAEKSRKIAPRDLSGMNLGQLQQYYNEVGVFDDSVFVNGQWGGTPMKEGRCEDFPCCGHEAGDCPSHDAQGNEVWSCAGCHGKLPKNSRSSLCPRCLRNMSRRAASGEDVYGDGDRFEENVGANEPFTTKWKMDKEKAGMVKLSEAFEKMRGLANLGERRVLSNGLWGNITEGKDKKCEECGVTLAAGYSHKICKDCVEDQEASDPQSPKYDWNRFGTSGRKPADYKEGIDKSRLNEIKNTLNAKAQAGTMTAKETKLYGLVKEALSKQK